MLIKTAHIHSGKKQQLIALKAAATHWPIDENLNEWTIAGAQK